MGIILVLVIGMLILLCMSMLVICVLVKRTNELRVVMKINRDTINEICERESINIRLAEIDWRF